MKILCFGGLVLTLSVVLSVTPLSAAEVSGQWSGTLEFKNTDGETKMAPAYLSLKQEGNKLTGSGGPSQDKQHPIQNGKVEGDKLTFEAADGDATMYFDLKVKGDQITGYITGRDSNGATRTAKISLKRVVER